MIVEREGGGTVGLEVGATTKAVRATFRNSKGREVWRSYPYVGSFCTEISGRTAGVSALNPFWFMRNTGSSLVVFRQLSVAQSYVGGTPAATTGKLIWNRFTGGNWRLTGGGTTTAVVVHPLDPLHRGSSVVDAQMSADFVTTTSGASQLMDNEVEEWRSTAQTGSLANDCSTFTWRHAPLDLGTPPALGPGEGVLARTTFPTALTIRGMIYWEERLLPRDTWP